MKVYFKESECDRVNAKRAKRDEWYALTVSVVLAVSVVLGYVF